MILNLTKTFLVFALLFLANFARADFHPGSCQAFFAERSFYSETFMGSAYQNRERLKFRIYARVNSDSTELTYRLEVLSSQGKVLKSVYGTAYRLEAHVKETYQNNTLRIVFGPATRSSSDSHQYGELFYHPGNEPAHHILIGDENLTPPPIR